MLVLSKVDKHHRLYIYNTELSEAEERIICSGNDVFVTVEPRLKDYGEFRR